MTEHLTGEQLEAFRDGLISPEELLAADRHIAECAVCADLIESDPAMQIGAAKLVGRFRFAFDHLTYEEFEAIADGNMNGVELEHANLHLESCASCTAELAAISELKPVEDFPASSIAIKETRPRFSFGLLTPALAAIVLMVVGVAMWTLLRPDRSNELADAEPQQTELLPNEDIVNAPGQPTTDAPINTIELAPELVVQLADGNGNVGIDQDDKLIGVAAGGHYDELAHRALKDGLLTIRNRQDLRSRPSTLLGDNAPEKKLELVSPLTRVLNTTRPTLVWRAVPGATAYEVEVFDDDFRKVASSGPTTATRWNPTLARGRTYLWQVTAKTSDGDVTGPVRPQPEARFKILDAKRADSIERLEREGRKSDLLLAVAYADAGMLAEAKEHLLALQKKNPRSILVRKLLAQVR